MHIHMDIVGGIAGDMFCAAMLDAFPELAEPLQNQWAELPFFANYQVQVSRHSQKEIVGKRFLVMKKNAVVDDKQHIVFTPQTSARSAVKHPTQLPDHHHYSWQTIQQRIHYVKNSDVRALVTAIYQRLIEAESAVHGIPVEDIHLHEVGADDALIDIISAAFLIHHSGATSWSCSSLPWGNGVLRCAHGELPVPAPATVKLLKGFTWRQDEEQGERVTPTGAAILASVCTQTDKHLTGHLSRDGYGCGKRQFKQVANVLRISVFEPSVTKSSPMSEAVTIVQFDIDDMTAEALAIAQQQLRSQVGVIDLTSFCVQGKKQRMVFRNELLCDPEQVNALCQQIFILTSTLGVRYWRSERFILSRQQQQVQYAQHAWPVKLAVRPDGHHTAKLEADAWQAVARESYQQATRLKFHVENLALSSYPLSRKEDEN